MSDGAGMTGVAELQEVLLATDTLQEFLDEVAARAATEVSPGLSCGLTVRSDGRPLTIASSDGYANKLDQLQYRLDQGPCLTTLRTGKVVLDDGTDAGERWPLYRLQGEAAGLGVSLSVPVSHGPHVLAALNLYSHASRSFSPVERDRARGFRRPRRRWGGHRAQDGPTRRADRRSAGGAFRAGGHRPGAGHRHGTAALLGR